MHRTRGQQRARLSRHALSVDVAMRAGRTTLRSYASRCTERERERERERGEKSLEIMTRVSGGDSHLLVASSHSGLGNVTTG